MKNKYIWGLIVVVVVALGFWGGYFDVSKSDAVREEYRVDKLGIAFDYEKDVYVVDDLSKFIGDPIDKALAVAVYRVMNAEEKEELENSEGGREGPPAINILVFENSDNKSSSQWIDAFSGVSNIGLLMGDINRDAVVGGANAVKYRTDGLYLADNVVVASSGYIYHFIGAFLEEGSDIHKEFNNIVESVEFIPVIKSEAKIDIKVACESALVYMTFSSGEEADAFVADCIDGNHPDVIDRYINDMGLDEAVI